MFVSQQMGHWLWNLFAKRWNIALQFFEEVELDSPKE